MIQMSHIAVFYTEADRHKIDDEKLEWARSNGACTVKMVDVNKVPQHWQEIVAKYGMFAG